MEILDKQDTIDVPDVVLSKSELFSKKENDPELASLFKLLLPLAELDKVPVGCFARNDVLVMK